MTRRRVLSLSFDLPFEAAIAAARARKVELPEDYYQRAPGEARRAATTISGLTALDQIQGVLDHLDEALARGVSLEQWKRSASERGWGLPPSRLDTVFRTNVQTAYAQGHWRSFREHQARRPYLMWSAINDSRVRPAHLAMDGHIAPVDAPIWQQWHPPAGYNCRCTQISLTEEQARARGYGKQVRPQAEPDPGFENSEPGNLASSLQSAIEQRWAQCDLFGFGKTRRSKPVWCADDGRLALQRIERSLEDRTRLAPPEAVKIAEFALGAQGVQPEHAQLVLGPVLRASEIAAKTGVVLVGYEHALDNYGIRHALKEHGAEGENLRGQRALSPYDFLRVSLIVAEFDAVKNAGRSKRTKEQLVRFEKRIGAELFVYLAALRTKRRLLVPQSMWVRQVKG